MPITLATIQEAQSKLNKVQEAASKVNTILVKVQEDIYEGITLTATQKSNLLTAYQSAKAELITATNNLL